VKSLIVFLAVPFSLIGAVWLMCADGRDQVVAETGGRVMAGAVAPRGDRRCQLGQRAGVMIEGRALWAGKNESNSGPTY
jgi:hypothetical protein